MSDGDELSRAITLARDSTLRLVTCHGVFDSPTTQNTILVLEKGITRYGIPGEILTDHGTQSFLHASVR